MVVTERTLAHAVERAFVGVRALPEEREIRVVGAGRRGGTRPSSCRAQLLERKPPGSVHAEDDGRHRVDLRARVVERAEHQVCGLLRVGLHPPVVGSGDRVLADDELRRVGLESREAPRRRSGALRCGRSRARRARAPRRRSWGAGPTRALGAASRAPAARSRDGGKPREPRGPPTARGSSYTHSVPPKTSKARERSPFAHIASVRPLHYTTAHTEEVLPMRIPPLPPLRCTSSPSPRSCARRRRCRGRGRSCSQFTGTRSSSRTPSAGSDQLGQATRVTYWVAVKNTKEPTTITLVWKPRWPRGWTSDARHPGTLAVVEDVGNARDDGRQEHRGRRGRQGWQHGEDRHPRSVTGRSVRPRLDNASDWLWMSCPSRGCSSAGRAHAWHA